jgi:hypothetical protein
MTTTRSTHLTPTKSNLGRSAAGVALAALLAVGAAACGTSPTDQSAGTPEATVAVDTTATDSSSSDSVAVEASAVSTLSDEERAGLLYMVDEEKLAHDVYVTLGEVWGLQTFENISASETTHMAEVRTLLDRYGIPDPTIDLAIGEFADPAFTALYDQLVAQGRTSVTEALAVGAGIEELDIVDLDVRAAQTDETAIAAVYANLRSGSENHLRAFVGALEARGVTYSPVHLDQASYDAVLAASTSRGRGQG